MSRKPGEAHVLRIGSPSLLNADKSDEKGLMNRVTTGWSLVTLTTAAYMEQCSLEWTGSRETTGEELETVLTENFLAILPHSWKGILLKKKKKNGRAQAKALGNPGSK